MTPPTAADDHGLQNKVAIVSGAGGPIGEHPDDGITNGRAAAVLLARSGAKVCAVGRTPALIQHTVDLIEQEGGTAFAHVADVTKEDEARGVIEATLERYGRVDCLDNNVAGQIPGDITELSYDQWREMFAACVDSAMFMSKYAIPAMRAAGGGAIVNIGSLRSIRPQPKMTTAYTVTKGALIHLTKALAVDHGAEGIRANCIVLGPAHTPAIGASVDAAMRRQRAEASVLRREGTGWDTGQLVRFLVSDQSAWITGQSICLDGGTSLLGPKR